MKQETIIEQVAHPVLGILNKENIYFYDELKYASLDEAIAIRNVFETELKKKQSDFDLLTEKFKKKEITEEVYLSEQKIFSKWIDAQDKGWSHKEFFNRAVVEKEQIEYINSFTPAAIERLKQLINTNTQQQTKI
jgi:hypothetical protein